MKRLLPFGFAIALISSAFSACTLDFNQFQPVGTGGTGATAVGGGGTGGTTCSAECCAPDDCTPPTDVCKQSTCIANTCGEAPRTDGTETAMQMDGDCKKSVCQGGAVASVNDDADLPDDGNDCTVDACNGGMPESMPAAMSTPCTSNGGKLCDGDGACVKCLDDVDCPMETPACNQATHECVPADCADGKKNGDETDFDCGGPVCSPCDDDLLCDVASDCKSLVCGQNNHCTPPACDDTIKNGTEGDVDCGADCSDKCDPDQTCNIDGDCEGNDCTGVAGTCVPNCNDTVKNVDETDVDCGGGTCDDCDIGQDCAGSNGNCKSGLCGANDKCVAKSPLGAACMQGNQCLSNNCVDGVCCGSANCNGTCKSCAVPGAEGTCQDFASGTDPDNECAGAQVCQSGNCKKPDGQACGANGECLTGHFCTDGVCCGSLCNGTCEACNIAGSPGTCTKVANGQDPANECSGVTSCNGAGVCTKLANGTACGVGGECTSTNCIDGVCCDTACGALCMACTAAKTGGTNGTCANVTPTTDPDNECAAATPNCAAGGVCGP